MSQSVVDDSPSACLPGTALGLFSGCRVIRRIANEVYAYSAPNCASHSLLQHSGVCPVVLNYAEVFSRRGSCLDLETEAYF